MFLGQDQTTLTSRPQEMCHHSKRLFSCYEVTQVLHNLSVCASEARLLALHLVLTTSSSNLPFSFIQLVVTTTNVPRVFLMDGRWENKYAILLAFGANNSQGLCKGGLRNGKWEGIRSERSKLQCRQWKDISKLRLFHLPPSFFLALGQSMKSSPDRQGVFYAY